MIRYIICGLFLVSNCWANDLNIDAHSGVMKAFNNYKNDLIRNKSVSKYFSKEMKDEWKGFIEHAADTERKNVISKIKNREMFGKRIKKVYEFDILSKLDSLKYLQVVYTNVSGKGPYLYELKYKLVSGKWLIDGTHSDITRPGPECNKGVLEKQLTKSARGTHPASRGYFRKSQSSR